MIQEKKSMIILVSAGLCISTLTQTYYQDLESSETYDTLKQSDMVRNQYMTLPYPAVSD